jgi:hypothetical protein
MFFAVLTFATALSIEALATLISVIGLSTFFGANPIIVAVAIALDVGKIIVVSLLYKYWRELSKLMRVYAVLATCITMLITSAGAAGYLTSEFQKAMVGTQEIALKVEALREEQTRLLARKQQIDNQVANLPANYGRTRVNVMREFEAEQRRITARLEELDRELPTLRIEQVTTEAKAGPIVAISKAFDIPVEEAAKYVIALIIFVFDPLAVFLIVAGNFLWERHRRPGPPPQEPPAPATPPVPPMKPTEATTPEPVQVPPASPVVAEAVPEEMPSAPPAEPKPIVDRKEIKLRDLQPPPMTSPARPYHSSLNRVRADTTVSFDDHPTDSAAHYRDQK